MHEGEYGSNVCPFSECIITVTTKFTYILGACFTNLRLFFYKVSFVITTFLPPLCEILYAGRVNLFAEASELFTYAVFQFIVCRKMASLECILQGAKKVEGDRC
jgi:hypothetical protein